MSSKYVFPTLVILVLIGESLENLQEDIELEEHNNTLRSLSRKRRYLVFPEGSSFQLVYCLTYPSVAVGQLFVFGNTAALAWELPSKPEFFEQLKHKTTTTTTTTTTTEIPHDHFHGWDDDFDHPVDHDWQGKAPSDQQRIDYRKKNTGSVGNKWKSQYPASVEPVKSYYNPFALNKNWQGQSINTFPNKKWSGTNNYQTGARQNTYSRYKSTNHVPVSTYMHPVYQRIHRRTRRDLYGKIEKLFSALNWDGKSCVLKAICEVTQKTNEKGTFLEEIIKAIFRIKPHEGYPDEDHFDKAANRSHNCTEQYPSCNGSVWSNMFMFNKS